VNKFLEKPLKQNQLSHLYYSTRSVQILEATKKARIEIQIQLIPMLNEQEAIYVRILCLNSSHIYIVAELLKNKIQSGGKVSAGIALNPQRFESAKIKMEP
jgi:hypothetical protein